MIESLESRRMMADVTAVRRADGSIHVTGTAAADYLSIGDDVDDTVATLYGVGDTTINGQESFAFSMPESSTMPVLVDLGNGDDTVEIGDAFNWSGEVGILGGRGNDRVILSFSAYRNAYYYAVKHVYFAGGDGDDTLGVAERTIGDVIFEGGSGRDRAYFSNVLVNGRLNVVDRSGPTNLTAVNVAIARSLRFDTGNSLDRLSLERVKTNGPLYVQTRGGDDTFDLIGRNRFASKQVDLGDDPNDRLRVLP